ESAAAMTIGWLKHYGFPTVNVLFADDKMTLARRQGCTFAVEDSERHAGNYAAGGIACFLINRDGAHSARLDTTIEPVISFAEILDALGAIVDTPGRRDVVAAALPPMIGTDP